MKTIYVNEFDSLIGRLTVIADDKFIIRLLFDNDNKAIVNGWLSKTFGDFEIKGSNTLADNCEKAVTDYLSGKSSTFALPIKTYGTAFEEKIWNQLVKIPYGQTVSYTKLGKHSDVNGARAVGSAVGRNPLPLIIPCHRVIRSDGGLGGFRGGLDKKKILLKLENIII